MGGSFGTIDIFQSKLLTDLARIVSNLGEISAHLKTIVTMQNHHELLSEVRADVDFLKTLIDVSKEDRLPRDELSLVLMMQNRLLDLLGLEYVDGKYRPRPRKETPIPAKV